MLTLNMDSSSKRVHQVIWAACLALGLQFLPECTESQVMLGRVQVFNATPAMITDVEVWHYPTNRFSTVSAILPGHFFEITFAERALTATKANISWRDENGRKWQEKLELPDGNDRTVASLSYVINPRGRASVELEPLIPDP